MAVFDYARVSTDGQTLASQRGGADCVRVRQDICREGLGSGTDRAELAKVMKRLERDDLLIVTRLVAWRDQLAIS